MKTLSLQLHCSPQEALALLEFLDQLRDGIAAEYQEEISLLFKPLTELPLQEPDEPFDDPIDF